MGVVFLSNPLAFKRLDIYVEMSYIIALHDR